MGYVHKNKWTMLMDHFLLYEKENSTTGTQKKGMATFILIRSLAVQ